MNEEHLIQMHILHLFIFLELTLLQVFLNLNSFLFINNIFYILFRALQNENALISKMYISTKNTIFNTSDDININMPLSVIRLYTDSGRFCGSGHGGGLVLGGA